VPLPVRHQTPRRCRVVRSLGWGEPCQRLQLGGVTKLVHFLALCVLSLTLLFLHDTSKAQFDDKSMLQLTSTITLSLL
jgi:hypothetical protein